MNVLPIYEALITDETQGIFNISLVDCPAVKSNFLAFKNQKQFNYTIQNEEKRIVFGVLMRANYNIYRYDKNLGEFYIRYSPETIKVMAEKMMLDNRHNSINIQHTDGSNVEGVNLIELFIKDTEKGINPKGFEEIEDGSLFAAYKVENPVIWNAIKKGVFNGFSLEGIFDITKLKTKQKMSLKTKIMNALFKFGEVQTDKGMLYWTGEDDLKVGDEVYFGDEKDAAADGDYVTEDGKTIKVVEGAVAEIIDPKAEVDSQTEEMEEETNEEVIDSPAETAEPSTDKYDALVAEIEVMKATIEEMKAEIAALKSELESLKNSFNEIITKPASEPIEQEFNKINKQDVKKGKACSILSHLND